MGLIFYQNNQAVKGEMREEVILWRRYGELGTVDQAGCFEMDR